MVRLHSAFRPMNESHRLPTRFYFALPRLLAMLRGGDTRRAEQNGAEAWAAGIATYVISYIFFAESIPDNAAWWLGGLLLVALAFLVLLFWLLALYLNSLVLKFLGWCGLFRTLPARRGQSVLVGTTATAMALGLLQRGPLAGELGAIWLTALAMNLTAAVVLAFRNGDHARV
jgi:apolipoprotein N-acyltransferase